MVYNNIKALVIFWYFTLYQKEVYNRIAGVLYWSFFRFLETMDFTNFLYYNKLDPMNMFRWHISGGKLGFYFSHSVREFYIS